MTANSVAQYLDQKRVVRPIDWNAPKRDGSSQPQSQSRQRNAALAAMEALAAEAVAAKPRNPAFAAMEAQAAEPPAPFRRLNSPLGDPAPEYPPAAPEDYGEGYGERRGLGVFRPRSATPPAPPPMIDIEAKLSEAYHRGVQEGLDAARNEAAQQRAMERAELQKRAVIERLDYQMNEYAKVAETLAAGLAEIERRIADVVARILRPFLGDAVARQAVEDLARQIAKLTTAGHPPLLKIRGPERLLAILKGRVDAMAIEVEFASTGGVEITVEAQHTTLQTEIGAWLESLKALQEGG